MIAGEGLADHIDMNFGRPAPKVTKRGGGAVLPFKRRLPGQIVAAAVRATEGTDIPVTVKCIGIDDAHHMGCRPHAEVEVAVALHACTSGHNAIPAPPTGNRSPGLGYCPDDSGARQRRSTMPATHWP